LLVEVDAVCGTWAVKDLDCPKNGCFGFAFTLPDDFVADGVSRRPNPERFPPTAEPKTGLPSWATKFIGVDAATAGAQCQYSKVPYSTAGCPAAP
jgi:hypothetical protein